VLLTPLGLKALGIADEADLPPNAKFEQGEDAGWISGDSAAVTGLYARLPAPMLAESMEGTRQFLHELNRFGITGVFDPADTISHRRNTTRCSGCGAPAS